MDALPIEGPSVETCARRYDALVFEHDPAIGGARLAVTANGDSEVTALGA